jgi:hypothetical protein
MEFLKIYYTTYSPSLPSHLSNLGLSMPLNREPLSLVLGSLHDCRAYQVYVSAYFSVECAWVPRRRNASLVFDALLFGLTRAQYSTEYRSCRHSPISCKPAIFHSQAIRIVREQSGCEIIRQRYSGMTGQT